MKACPICNDVINVRGCELCGGSGLWDDPDYNSGYYEDEWYDEDDGPEDGYWIDGIFYYSNVDSDEVTE